MEINDTDGSLNSSSPCSGDLSNYNYSGNSSSGHEKRQKTVYVSYNANLYPPSSKSTPTIPLHWNYCDPTRNSPVMKPLGPLLPGEAVFFPFEYSGESSTSTSISGGQQEVEEGEKHWTEEEIMNIFNTTRRESFDNSTFLWKNLSQSTNKSEKDIKRIAELFCNSEEKTD